MSALVEAKSGRIVAWNDSIPLRYEYTAGVAGEVFLKMLKEGRIVASKCLTCGETRIPPRIYCLNCGCATRIDVELLHYGQIAAISRLHTVEGTKELIAFGFVTFEGISGGILHRILTDGKAARVGDIARASFKPLSKREGSILDIEGFRTGSGRKRGND